MRLPVVILIAVFLFLMQIAAAQQEEPAEDPAAYIREAYHRLVNEEAMDFDESRKLVEECRKQIALLAENDPEGLVTLAREILLDNPELLESEKMRGLKPPRLEVKGSLMGALVVIGSESAHELLAELAMKVESGEAKGTALGSSPGDLLEVPVKYDKMILKVLDGKSADPKADLENAIRFAQEHFVLKILLAEDIPGLSLEEFKKIGEKAHNRINSYLINKTTFNEPGTYSNPLEELKCKKIEKLLLDAFELNTRLSSIEDLIKLYEKQHLEDEKRKKQIKKRDIPEKPDRAKEEEGKIPSVQEKLELEKMNLPDDRQENETSSLQQESENLEGVSTFVGTTYILVIGIIIAGAVVIAIAVFILVHRRNKAA